MDNIISDAVFGYWLFFAQDLGQGRMAIKNGLFESKLFPSPPSDNQVELSFLKF